jgi:hypothetical protein
MQCGEENYAALIPQYYSIATLQYRKSTYHAITNPHQETLCGHREEQHEPA